MVASVTTRSYDRARTGTNNSETVLTATAVRTRGIVKLFSLPIPDDPRLEAQPLAVGGVHTADGKTRDLIFQASMGNWVYAFDAVSGEKIWATNLGRPIVGTRAIDGHMTNVHWGILSTPVIDEGAGILYACAWISDDGSVAKGQHFLAALRIRDGSKVHGLLNLEGAVYTPPNGLPVQKFISAQRKQRSALTLTRNHVLIPFGTIAETSKTARGWLLAVDVHAWRLATSWCSTVTGSGGGLWQSGPARPSLPTVQSTSSPATGHSRRSMAISARASCGSPCTPEAMRISKSCRGGRHGPTPTGSARPRTQQPPTMTTMTNWRCRRTFPCPP
jgi:hypothetical protein